MLKSLQFELWEDCNSGCTFCYLDKYRDTSSQTKIKSLEDTIKKISDMTIYKTYDVLSYIGGEFFQGQLSDATVRKLFFQLIDKTAELSDNGYLKQVWISATLTIGNQADLYETISKFKDKSKLWICTSYDTKGRFHSQKMHDNWKFHMQNIKKLYPEIQLNSCIILTGDLVEKYNNGIFSFKQFMSENKTEIFLKTPGVPCTALPELKVRQQLNEQLKMNFFPKRSDFLKFLVKFKQVEGDYLYDKIYNIDCRADNMIKNTNDDHQIDNMAIRVKTKTMNELTEVNKEIKQQPKNKCGHLLRYSPYIDSDACFICDKLMIQGGI